MHRRHAVLIADDSEEDTFILKRAFSKAGIEAQLLSVKDGQEAINYLSGEGSFGDRAAHPLPHLILLDLKMPKLDGFDVLRWLQTQPKLKCVPVTVLSSSNEDKDVDSAYDLGANSYVVKPDSSIGYEAIVAKLRDYWMELNRPPSVIA